MRDRVRQEEAGDVAAQGSKRAMPAAIRAIARQLGFVRCEEVAGRTSIADLFPPARRCGIYLLELTSGEVYAGQAVDVTRRYGQHRHTYPNIVAIHFKEVAESRLDEVEQRVIKAIEEKGLRPRNITYASTVPGKTDLDEVMAAAEQDRFRQEITFNTAGGARTDASQLRQKLAGRYTLFRTRPHAGRVERLLETYVPRCVPAFVATEISFWYLSAPPRVSWWYARLNVGWQEVLTALEADDGALAFRFHVAASPLGLFGQQRRAAPLPGGVEIGEPLFKHGGPDQIQVTAPYRTALRLLDEPDFLRAARALNLRLMQKSPAPHRKFHCFALADRVLPMAPDRTAKSRAHSTGGEHPNA